MPNDLGRAEGNVDWAKTIVRPIDYFGGQSAAGSNILSFALE